MQLSYDVQGRLSIWQDQPTSPTTTVNYLYDGSGNRVATQSTVNGTTTLTSYIGSVEEVQTSGSSTQTTTYYSVGGKRVAADVNGTFYYFGYDALGSQVAVLNATGSLVGAQLYGPYGASRYNTGTLPTSIGFTGQRAESVTGLDYYNARYYDPTVGQFLSVDSVQGNAQGMDPYAYVGGNPESTTDPTGNGCYDPGTQVYKPNCGHPVSNPPTKSDNGGGSTTQPLQCGSGTHLVGNTCEASITSCGSGTYQQGNQCVNDANSPANKARDKRLSGLKSQVKWELVAGDLLVLAGLIFNIITNASIGPMIVFILQAVSLISNNLLGHLGDLVGNSGLLEGMLRFASVLDKAAGWLEGLAAIYTAAAWWKKNVILATVSAFKVGTLGPEQIIVTALLTAAKPVVGFLLDAGAQFLYAKALADQAEVERQTNMPLAQWCAIYQGCSAY